MRIPSTVFSTRLRGGRGALRARLRALFAGRRRLGMGLMAGVLCAVVLAGALVAAQPRQTAPLLTPENLCPLLEYEGRQPASATVLASGERDGATVAAVLARYEEPYALVLYPGLVARGTPLTLEGAWEYLGPLHDAQAWTSEDGDRLLLHFLARLDGVTPSLQGGCLAYEGGRLSWQWPAPSGSVPYETFWSDMRQVSTQEGQPFVLLAQGDSLDLDGICRSYLLQTITPALESRGITPLGFQLIPRDLGLISLPQGLEPYEVPQLWLLDYRVLPANPDTARAAGFSLDSQGWLLPDASLGWLTVAVNQAGQQVCSIPVDTSDIVAAAQQAQDALDQSPTSPDASTIPQTDEGGQYDPDTGIFYSQVLDLGYLVPEPLRDTVCFRHSTGSDGAPVLTLSLRASLAWGEGMDGRLWQVTVQDLPPGKDPYYGQMAGTPLWMDRMLDYGAVPGQSCFCLTVFDEQDVLFPSPAYSLPWLEAHNLISQSDLDHAFFQNPALPTEEDFTVLPYPDGYGQPPSWRIGIGTQGELGLGEPLPTRTSTRYVREEGDYWLEETYDGALATSYVEGATGTRTLIRLEMTMECDGCPTRRNVAVGAPAYEAMLCYSGQDYGYAIPHEPLPQDFFLTDPDTGQHTWNPQYAGQPLRFYIQETQGGIPLPCTYWLEFYFSEDTVRSLVLYADLLGGRSPF